MRTGSRLDGESFSLLSQLGSDSSFSRLAFQNEAGNTGEPMLVPNKVWKQMARTKDWGLFQSGKNILNFQYLCCRFDIDSIDPFPWADCLVSSSVFQDGWGWWFALQGILPQTFSLKAWPSTVATKPFDVLKSHSLLYNSFLGGGESTSSRSFRKAFSNFSIHWGACLGTDKNSN